MPRLLLAQSNCLISKQPGSRSPTAGCHRGGETDSMDSVQELARRLRVADGGFVWKNRKYVRLELPLDMPTDQSIFEGRKQAIDFIANGAPLPP